jgi:hypothetical protein
MMATVSFFLALNGDAVQRLALAVADVEVVDVEHGASLSP